MGIFRRTSRGDHPREVRSVTVHPFMTGAATDGTRTEAGVSVNADTALRLSAVWACARLLADTISTLPVDVYRKGDPDVALPTPALLQRPSDAFSTIEWLHALTTSLALRGNAYGIVTGRTGAAGWPAQIELVNPDVVAVYRNDEGRISYEIGGQGFDRADVFHVRAFTVPGNLVGLSPIEHARQAIGVGIAAEQFGARFFGDNATPSGLLIAKGQMNAEGADVLKARWKAAHHGRRELAVLSGDVEFQSITISPNESQFVETQKFTVAQIARLFGIPPEMIGGEAGGSLTYANVEQRALDFVTFSLGPWVARIEAALTALLPRNQFVKLNTGALLRADLKTRYEAHAIGIGSGFLTVDEARALEDRPPLGYVSPAPGTDATIA
jgi:HK97 family phage portal protein